MPFTYGCMIIGGLALSGIPPFSGFWSKDEIIALEFERGGWHTILGVAAYLGAFLTAIYTFRMIFRAFHGDPCPEAEELAHGHLYHAPEPTNPATGEVEDTDIGFPGPEHHIAEQAPPMKIAMGALAAAGDRRRLPADPGRQLRAAPLPRADVRGLRALRDARADARRTSGSGCSSAPSSGSSASASRGGSTATAATPRRSRRASRGLHKFFVNKWYFDEAIDFLIVRPFAWFGRFANSTFERVFVNGALVGGSTGAVRVLSAAVRGIQSGYLRYYAALLLVGLTGLSAYFLISA